MRFIFTATAAAALMLSGCGGSQTETAETDVAATDMATPADTGMTDPAMDTAMAPAAAGGAAVTVTVNGVTPNGGPVLVALQNEGNFTQKGGTYTQTVDPTGATVTASFNGVAPGAYAAAVVQDADSNGDITIGERGPSEPWGLSGPAQKGAPQFTPASFQVTQDGGTATVSLQPK